MNLLTLTVSTPLGGCSAVVERFVGFRCIAKDMSICSGVNRDDELSRQSDSLKFYLIL